MNIIKLALSFMLVFFTLTIQAQSKKEQQLTRVLETFRHNLIDPNETALLSITSPKLSYGHSAGLVENQTVFIANLMSGKSDFVSIDIQDQSLDIDNNNAYVRHTFNAVAIADAKTETIKLKILSVWVYEKGAWKLRARQAVKILK